MRHDLLIPACGGTETPFTVNGRLWLYCWHPKTNSHVYLDVKNDIAIWNREFHPSFNPEAEYNEPNLPVNYQDCHKKMTSNDVQEGQVMEVDWYF